MAPAMVPTARGQRVKNDRLDATKPCEICAAANRTAFTYPRCSRDLGHLVQLRDTHVKQPDCYCRIKVLLLYEGMSFSGSGTRSAPVLREVAALPCSTAVRFRLDRLIGTLHFHFDSAATVQREIRRYCEGDMELRHSIA